MPSRTQTIVEPDAASTTAVYGARKDANLEAAYPESPIHSGEISDGERKKLYTSVITDGVAAGGFGVKSFNPEYTSNGAPNFPITEVPNDLGEMIDVGGGGGAPTNSFVPPLVSPGKGNFNASSQGPWNGPDPAPTPEYGSGVQRMNPKTSSGEIESLKIGDTLITGRSFKGSDGRE